MGYLDKLTPELIAQGPLPLSLLLKNVLYYPAGLFDGRPIECCHKYFRHWGIENFIYCDYIVDADALQQHQDKINGYHLLAYRDIPPEELFPAGLRFTEPPVSQDPTFNALTSQRSPSFARWLVYERKSGKGEEHGTGPVLVSCI
jgi:hypothetical protein